MKHIVAFAFTLLLAGCALLGSGASNLNLVSLGMNKTQVTEIMGNPDTSSAQAPHEYFIYYLTVDYGIVQNFFVRFENGVVESYGRVGDFDSSQVPEATINVNRN